MIERLRYVRLPCDDLAVARAFALDVIGLQDAGTTGTTVRFRSNEHAYSLEFEQSDRTPMPVVGFEVRFTDQLEAAASMLARRGLVSRRATPEDCTAGLFEDGLGFCDHSGNAFELVVRPHDKAHRFFPSRDAGIAGLQRVALRSTAIDDDIALWSELFGFRATDYVGRAAYLALDHAHHRLALHPSARNGILNVGFAVEDMDHIMQHLYFLEQRQIRTLFGPGREPASGAATLVFEGPYGSAFSFGTGMRSVDAEWRARQFADEPSSFCGWESPNSIPELAGGQAL